MIKYGKLIFRSERITIYELSGEYFIWEHGLYIGSLSDADAPRDYLKEVAGIELPTPAPCFLSNPSSV